MLSSQKIQIPSALLSLRLPERLASLCLTYFVLLAVHSLFELFWTHYISLFSSMQALYIFTQMGTNLMMLTVLNLLLGIVYKANLPIFEQKKVLNRPWPWEQNKQEWLKTLRKALKGIALNFLVAFATCSIDVLVSGINVSFQKQKIPDPWTSLAQIIFFVIVEDFLFYFGHMLLHKPQFYWIHKQHHQFNHTIGLAAQYCHPIQFVLTNLIPFGIGPKLLGSKVHIVTYAAWIVIKLMQTTEAHCGYDFGVGVMRFLPFQGSSDFHNFHHSFNVGNFGQLTFWDWVMGTRIHYDKAKGDKAK